ncbi:MAG: hypothetical protein L3I99_06915 [Sulfurimonas sp.]|nr:hypothetical protein [Sulfurimonas sp.]
MKKILSLDLGITSIGYSILKELDNDRYSLVDYGVSMFDKPTDKDGNSKKLLYSLRKKRKQNLAKLFEDFNLAKKIDLLNQEIYYPKKIKQLFVKFNSQKSKIKQ